MDNKSSLLFHFMMDDGLDMNVIGALPSLLQMPSPITKEIFRARDRRKFVIKKTFDFNRKFNDDQFYEYFRMTKSTFESLLNVIGRQVDEADEEPIMNICVKTKLLFSIWLLSKSETFNAAGKRFKIPTSSGHGIFKFIISIMSDLLPTYVKWPNADQMAISNDIFEQRSDGIPGVVGAINSCHISIRNPDEDSKEYLNRKMKYSIILQGVCDHNMRFIHVFIGMPGGLTNTDVFRNSDMYVHLMNEENQIVEQDQHLIGDSAYPLMMSLMTPYGYTEKITAARMRYNRRLEKIRSIIDKAFVLLKGKFRRLKWLDIGNMNFGNQIIGAACMLHNFIIDNGEKEYVTLKRDDGSDSEMDESNEDTRSLHDLIDCDDAIEKRKIIVKKLAATNSKCN